MSIGSFDFFDQRLDSKRVKTAIKALAASLIFCMALSMSEFDAQSRDIADKVVRLHIIANSDSEKDQALKLKVRDNVQTLCESIYPDGCDKACAEMILQDKLDELTDEARRVLREEGCMSDVHGELVNMYFPTRVYDDFTLPAGYYDAVRLIIGNGEGHNWWCVMFPPLCVNAAEKTDIGDALTQEQAELVTSGKVEYKFKLYELYESAAGKIENFKARNGSDKS